MMGKRELGAWSAAGLLALTTIAGAVIAGNETQQRHAAETHAEECSNAAYLWRATAKDETQAMQDWLGDILGPSLDLTKTNEDLTRAQDAGC